VHTVEIANSEAPAIHQSPAFVSKRRIESIDFLRGLIMILMALDHTRDLLGVPGVNPTDLAQTNTALFLTRWVTHFCAPVFFLLTGTGAYLLRRKTAARHVARYLVRRGLWLILLELTAFRCLGFQFNFDYHVTFLNVLWALGWAMITLSVLVYLPVPLTAAIGLGIIAGHNLLDANQSSNPIWSILHSCNFIVNRDQHTVFVGYPLIPWVGVTAVGYSLGEIYSWTALRRKAFLLRTGMSATALFVILRGINMYGDPVHWSKQKSLVMSALSFVNTSKYPPSLLFLLMTLGPALLFLRSFDNGTPRVLSAANTLGRVPLFFFLLHIPLIHLIAVALCYLRYGQIHWMFESPTIAQFPFTFPPGWGLSLPAVYLAWICVVLALYPLCAWFAGVKRRRHESWLGYL
jgi:uncharacterized membrane protein